MIRRLFGSLMLFIGLAGLVLSVAGNQFGHKALDGVETAVSDALSLTSQSLDTVQETLLITKDTVTVVGQSLTTVANAATNLGGAIEDTQPLLNELAQISSRDLPNSLDAIQETIPNVAQAAKVIDDALVALNRFRFEETIPILNYTISWNLGVNYNPTVPFDAAVIQIGDSLKPLPARLRVLEAQIMITGENMQAISGDVYLIGDDLAAVNEQLNALYPLIDEYVAMVTLINDTSRQTRASIKEQLESLKSGITWIMIWLALFQVVPLYLGYELITGHLSGQGTPQPDLLPPNAGKEDGSD